MSKEFIYAKVYQKAQDESGAWNVDLNPPKFRNTGQKEKGIVFDKSEVTGKICEVKMSSGFDETSADDLAVVMVTDEEVLRLQFPSDRNLGRQLLKRLPAIDYSKDVTIGVWRNSAGYANLTVYQNDEDGKKVFCKDAFASDGSCPEVSVVTIGKKTHRDYSEMIDYLVENSVKAIQPELEQNKMLITESVNG